MIYRPETERQSHYFQAQLTDQFDAVLHFDETRAVERLETTADWEMGEPPENVPVRRVSEIDVGEKPMNNSSVQVLDEQLAESRPARRCFAAILRCTRTREAWSCLRMAALAAAIARATGM